VRAFFAALLVGGLVLFAFFFLKALGAGLCDSGSCPSDAALRHYQTWTWVGVALSVSGILGLIVAWRRRR
jgi:hypothetical protein